ncbi:hypothetical protein SERLADRAFT_408758 [Serpula lacrymans var. lacrymans S7.9]|uniref:SEC63 domain-containing protein n=1 Tax=Serpula lacrymans var. lacrymans (strain S7.9) TaxID=578457 RepID=F8NWI6_SERL9|nr:uncharacterized protein SERLADRAFT_408758 [Serpula lacrymans var. lacrymans S7.9]EGO25011.1 hypothetical protein SERLADRAFT_408758 [Serpula lacrymans var. lacrymans S7.9]
MCDSILDLPLDATVRDIIYDKLRLHAEIRFPIKKVQKTSDNIFLLIQAILGGIPLGGGDSQSHYEVSTVFRHISRIATAVVEVAIVKKSGAQAKHGLELARCLYAKVWEDRPVVLRQIEHIGEKSVTETNVTPSNGKDPVEIKLSIQCTKALGEPKIFPISAQLTKPDQSIFVYVSPEMDLAGLEDDPDFWNMDFADEDEETVFVKDPTKTLGQIVMPPSLPFYHFKPKFIAAEKDYLSLLKCQKSDFSQTPSTPRNITRTLDLRPKSTERNQKPPEGHCLKLANISSGDVSQQKTRVTPNFDLEFIHATRQIKKLISISSETSYSSSETDSLIRNLPLEFLEPSTSHYQRTMSQKAGHHRGNSGSSINGRYEAANECPPTKKPRFDVGGGCCLVTPSGLLDEKKTGFSGSPAKVQTEERQSLSDISEQDDTVDEDTPRGYTLENAAREQTGNRYESYFDVLRTTSTGSSGRITNDSDDPWAEFERWLKSGAVDLSRIAGPAVTKIDPHLWLLLDIWSLKAREQAREKDSLGK